MCHLFLVPKKEKTRGSLAASRALKKPWRFYRTRRTQVTRALKAMNSGDNRTELPYWDSICGAGEMQIPTCG
jgi:hypothetical protein